MFLILRFIYSFLVLCTLLSCTAAPRFAHFEISKSVNYQVLTDRTKIFPADYQYQETGIIFYPGGFVHPTAYIPLLSNIASQGYRIIIAHMPLDLAVLDQAKAQALIKDYPEIENWVIAGHSLGGAMAAEQVKQYPEAFSGLILLAAYPAQNTDLSKQDMPVLSISASEDGLSTPAEIEESKTRLPADAYYYQINGGNHAQFGDYGKQNDDLSASISRSRQEELSQYLINWFLRERINTH